MVEANSGEKVFITIKSSTSTGTSLRLGIEAIDDYYGIRKVEDSLFDTNTFNYRWEYTVPSYPDSTLSLLVFTLTNDLGETTEVAKRLLANKGESFLTEVSGVNIYSSASNKPNAFSLASLSPGFSTDTATFQSDIVDGTPADSLQLSRIWRSNTGLSFVKFDGFNYSNATSASVRNAYSNGVQLSRVSDIDNSDIYLIGNGNNALGVIQIIAVTDPEGVQEDKYTFSAKVINE